MGEGSTAEMKGGYPLTVVEEVDMTVELDIDKCRSIRNSFEPKGLRG